MLHHFSLPGGFLTLSAGLADSDGLQSLNTVLEVAVGITFKVVLFPPLLSASHNFTIPIVQKR